MSSADRGGQGQDTRDSLDAPVRQRRKLASVQPAYLSQVDAAEYLGVSVRYFQLHVDVTPLPFPGRGARPLQGLSDEWIATMEENAPFTVHGLKKVVGNGVPLPMGRAIAKAVRRAMYPESCEATA